MWLPKIANICGNLVNINIDIGILLPRNKSDIQSYVLCLCENIDTIVLHF